MTNPKQNKELLGKGIRSLLQNIDADLKTTSGQLKHSVVENATGISRIPIADVETNPKQPRRDFDEKSLNELADSIRMHDIIQPITVTKLASGKYRLISGERRWRASQRAGLKDIPAYIRQANDAELLELALLENLQREDLNPIEEAEALQALRDALELTQEEYDFPQARVNVAQANQQAAQWQPYARNLLKVELRYFLATCPLEADQRTALKPIVEQLLTRSVQVLTPAALMVSSPLSATRATTRTGPRRATRVPSAPGSSTANEPTPATEPPLSRSMSCGNSGCPWPSRFHSGAVIRSAETRGTATTPVAATNISQSPG